MSQKDLDVKLSPSSFTITYLHVIVMCSTQFSAGILISLYNYDFSGGITRAICFPGFFSRQIPFFKMAISVFFSVFQKIPFFHNFSSHFQSGFFSIFTSKFHFLFLNKVLYCILQKFSLFSNIQIKNRIFSKTSV